MAARQITAITAIALLANSIPAHAKYTDGAAVASCADLDCNRTDNNTIAQCDIQGREYSAIGAVAFQSPFDTTTNLSWTEGAVFTYPTTIPAAVFVRDFFLGVPDGLDLKDESLGFQGCAAFFVDSNATFPLYEPPGTCSDTIGADCAKALQQQAGDAMTDEDIDSAEDVCSRMQDAFTNATPPSECSEMSLNGTAWGRIEFRPLTGPTAPKPPSEPSSCNPTLNTTSPYRLAHVLNFNATRGEDPLWNSSIHAIYDKYHPPSQPDGDNIYKFIQHQAVPILSVFAGQGRVQTGVSCLEAPIEFGQSHESNSGSSGRIGGALLAITVGMLNILFWML